MMPINTATIMTLDNWKTMEFLARVLICGPAERCLAALCPDKVNGVFEWTARPTKKWQ